MSVMDELKNVVTTARELFATVTGKMREIDQRVDAAVNSVPEAVLNEMGKTIYLDQENGNDINDGTSFARRVKTFARVASLSPSGGTVYIRLLSDYTFRPGESVRFDGVKALIGKSGEGTPKIKFSSSLSADGQYLEGQNLYALRDASFSFMDIDLELPDLTEVGIKGPRTCVISNNTWGDLPLPLALGFARVNILVPGGASNKFKLVRGNSMILLQSLGITAPQDWIDAGGFATEHSGNTGRVSARIIHTGTSLFPGA